MKLRLSGVKALRIKGHCSGPHRAHWHAFKQECANALRKIKGFAPACASALNKYECFQTKRHERLKKKLNFRTRICKRPLQNQDFQKEIANAIGKTIFFKHMGVERCGLKAPGNKGRPWIPWRAGLKSGRRLGVKCGLRGGLGCLSILAIFILETQPSAVPGTGQQLPCNK